jgi:uncharacterized membrane protein
VASGGAGRAVTRTVGRVKLAQTLSLLAATLSTGLIAGLFFSFANAVMPALRRVDDRAFVATMQQINRSILNAWFLSTFVGAALITATAAVLQWGDGRPALPWIIAGLVLYLVMFAITRGVNIPLNDQLDGAGDPDQIADLAAVRGRFEARWVRWNLVRALTSTAAFGVLAWALVLHGRALA